MEPERTDHPAGAPASEGTVGPIPDPTAEAPEPAAVQETLPFGPDEPIPYRLTARARRFVAPEGLPSLQVVDRTEEDEPPTPVADDGPVDLDDPHDTRPSQARALRRAGLSLAQIARELDVDALVAQAWVDDVDPVHSARRRLRAVGRDGSDRGAGVSAQDVRRQAAFAARRDEAARTAAGRLDDDVAFARGLGLAAGVLTTSEHAALLTTRERRLAAAALRWIVAETGVAAERVRVLLRLAPQVAGDAAAHAWAEQLGLPPERVVFTRWRGAPDAEAVEATVRIADPQVAGTLAGWCDALLGDVPTSGTDDDF